MRDPSKPDPGSPDVQRAYYTLGRELWARLYAHCCDRDLALEALHEAFLKLLEKKNEPIGDLSAWLFTVGRNWLLDDARQTGRRPEHQGDFRNLESLASGPVRSILTAELHGQVRDGLARLEAQDREVLVLKYALDWNSRRIAAALGLTPEAVDMRLSRARRRMAGLLSTSGVDHGTE